MHPVPRASLPRLQGRCSAPRGAHIFRFRHDGWRSLRILLLTRSTIPHSRVPERMHFDSGCSPALSLPRLPRIVRLLSAAWLCLLPLALQAQIPPDDAPRVVTPHPTAWADHLAALSANALLGGLTAGVIQELRGGSFQDGFTRGALGGGVVYAGKRAAAERFGGAGLLGRGVAALGSSVIRNAGEGRGSLDRLLLPVGPVRVAIAADSLPRVRAKIDLLTVFWIGYGIAEPALEFDAGRSLSAGAPVFVAPGRDIRWKGANRAVAGTVPAGVILLSDDDPVFDSPARRATTFAHERVHVLQYDQALVTWVDPLESWVLPKVPHGEFVRRHANVLTPLIIAPFFLVGRYEARPWEAEARFFAR